MDAVMGGYLWASRPPCEAVTLQTCRIQEYAVTYFMENFCPEICGALEDAFLFGLPHMWHTVSKVSL